jgi:hypothetical protein
MANMELIEVKTLASAVASVTFSTIPQTYTDLKLLISSKSSEGSQSANYWIQFNSDTGANYTNKRIYSGATTAASDNGNTGINGISAGFIPGDIANTTSTFSNCEIYIPNYAGSATKSVSCDSSSEGNQTSGVWLNTAAGLWNNTAAITSLTIAVTGASQTIGSTFYLYGISNVTSGSKATGGVVSSDGTYYYHMFPFSGTFTPTESITADVLVIAGGGGGGVHHGGGGGAGGLRSTVTATGGGGSLESPLSLTAQAYTVTVGAGGTGSTNNSVRGTAGANSVFSTITSTGGGGGGSRNTEQNGGAGGSGGGGGYTGAGGARTASPVQGFNGGGDTAPNGAGGGGGGAGAAGASTTSAQGAAGGNGVQITAFANATQTGVNNGYYGGGGSGGWQTPSGGSAGAAGLGGGGVGSGTDESTATANGISNTGGGGGGGGYVDGGAYSAGAGGSGLVIIRYAI